jgi:parvulin-like peptidyl-prolyl isomerase
MKIETARIVCLATLIGCTAAAEGTAAPATETIVATVNGEPITLATVEAARDASPAVEDPFRVLDRMINVELVVQEGLRMGLQDSLEVTDQLGIFERDTLRDGVFARRLQSVKADPKETERLLTAMTTQVRLRSALFPLKADAERLRDRAARGDDFDAAAAEIASGGKGKVDPGASFIAVAELLPEVQAAIAPLAPGQTSAVYPVQKDFAVTRLVERRNVSDPEGRQRAEDEVVRRKQLEILAVYAEELNKKYARVDAKLEASLDFDAPDPGFDAYLKDTRPLVAIQGEAPITVGDLADAVRKRLFHGSGRAAEKGRLDRKRVEVLDDLISKRVVLKEARRLGLDKTPEYVAVRDRAERELVFGAFVAKVIEPEVKVRDEDVRRYHKDHPQEFTAPDMVRLDALPFHGRREAEEALAKLRSGADLAWMRTNAPGRLEGEAVPEGLRIPSTPLIAADLPAGLRQSLAGAVTGEYRVHATPEGPAAVVYVRERIEAAVRPVEDVDASIRGKLRGEKRQRAFEDYALELRKASEVRILVTADELRTLLAPAKPSS